VTRRTAGPYQLLQCWRETAAIPAAGTSKHDDGPTRVARFRARDLAHMEVLQIARAVPLGSRVQVTSRSSRDCGDGVEMQ
jgi:hypothetical protein